MPVLTFVTVVETPEFIRRVDALMTDEEREVDEDLGRDVQETNAMSKVGRSIRRGLVQAVEFARGRVARKAYRVHVPVRVDVREIRTKLGLTQQAFAAMFGFSINTLRHWEQGQRVPEGPTRAYLLVIARAPEAVQKALRVA